MNVFAPIVRCESFTPSQSEPCWCSAAILWGSVSHSIDGVMTAGPGTDIHQRPALHLCHLPIMDHNGVCGACIRNTPRNHISLIKEKLINGCYKFCRPGPDDSSGVCVCMHVCDELHYTSPIGLSQGPGHSSVPRHKAS